MGTGILDPLPLWAVFVSTSLVALASIEIGYRLGRYRHRISDQEKESPVSAMVGATLGLLGFVLAFTFGIAAGRFDSRRQGLVDEANAIGTVWLRAGLLSERTDQIRALLREYVDIRLAGAESGNLAKAVARSEEIHTQLWKIATEISNKNPNSITVGLFIQSLNELIDLHSKRVALALRSRIPNSIWLAVYFVAILSLGAMGYHGGLAETSRSLAVVAVAITFSVVIWLIADLDRPNEGSIRVDQQAMIDLRNSMK